MIKHGNIEGVLRCCFFKCNVEQQWFTRPLICLKRSGEKLFACDKTLRTGKWRRTIEPPRVMAQQGAAMEDDAH